MENKKQFLIISSIFAVACIGLPVYIYTKKSSAKGGLLKVSILTRESFALIMQEIRSVYLESNSKNLKRARQERRRCSRSSFEYSRVVSNFHKETKQILEEATQWVLSKYGTTKQTLEDSINYYDSDCELKEYSENLVLPVYHQQEASLSKQEVKEILSYFSKRFQELEAEDLDFDDYIIVTSQIEDEVFNKFKVEIDEVNAAYELFKDEFQDIVEPMRSQTSYIMASADDSFEI